MATILKHNTEITLLTAPTLEQMKTWWAALQQDPVRHLAYPDFMPTKLDSFLEAVHRGDSMVWMFLIGNEPSCIGGVFYLHDMGADADGPYAWIGTYILPPYRNVTLRAWELVRCACARQGLRRFFVAVRHSNRPAQMLLRRAGFVRLGIYPDWSYYEGAPDAVVLYTLRPEDQGVAWVEAEKRAQQVWRLVHVRGL
jgi:RimJ/RimL family protein N-acetyltransferase